MESLKTLAIIANFKNEFTRNEIMTYPSYFRKQLGVEYHGSKNFVEACDKGESYTVLKWLFGFEHKNKLVEGMAYAAENDHENTVRLWKELGATDSDSAMAYAAGGGHENTVRLCKDFGATDFDSAIIYAATNGHENIVELCKDFGANLDEAIEWPDYNAHKYVLIE